MVEITEEQEIPGEYEAESIIERIAGITDSLPLQSFAKLYNFSLDSVDLTFRAVQSIGSVAWVLVTSGLLLAVPVALEIEREGFIVQQETQQRVQQQQAQQVLQA